MLGMALGLFLIQCTILLIKILLPSCTEEEEKEQYQSVEIVAFAKIKSRTKYFVKDIRESP